MKKKLQTLGRFAVKHRETFVKVIMFTAGFFKEFAESKRKPRR